MQPRPHARLEKWYNGEIERSSVNPQTDNVCLWNLEFICVFCLLYQVENNISGRYFCSFLYKGGYEDLVWIINILCDLSHLPLLKLV